MEMLLRALAALLLVATFAAAIDVTVGPDLRFHPETVSGSPGELVNFHFRGSGFSASEATARLSDPCRTEGGFDSGIANDGSIFSIVISTHNSIYVFSRTQCSQGMVMIINPGPHDSVATYSSVAGGGGRGGADEKPSPSIQSSLTGKTISSSQNASPTTELSTIPSSNPPHTSTSIQSASNASPLTSTITSKIDSSTMSSASSASTSDASAAMVSTDGGVLIVPTWPAAAFVLVPFLL